MLGKIGLTHELRKFFFQNIAEKVMKIFKLALENDIFREICKKLIQILANSKKKEENMGPF
jgi:hypothetical protein